MNPSDSLYKVNNNNHIIKVAKLFFTRYISEKIIIY